MNSRTRLAAMIVGFFSSPKRSPTQVFVVGVALIVATALTATLCAKPRSSLRVPKQVCSCLVEPGCDGETACRPLIDQATAQDAEIKITASRSGESNVNYPEREIDWLTGRSLDQKLKLGLTAIASDVPLRERLVGFSRRHRIAVFLDRRVDPSLSVTLALRHVTAEQLLWAIADQCELGVCRLDDFFYLGPKQTAACLPEAWRELSSSSKAIGSSGNQHWRNEAPLASATPAYFPALLRELTKSAKISIANPAAVQHDYWNSFSLPTMSLEKRLAILLIGFNAWPELDPKEPQFSIVSFPDQELTTTAARGIADARALAKELRSQFPKTKIKATKSGISAEGPWQDISALTSLLVKRQDAAGEPPAEQTFAELEVKEATRERVLQSLAQGTGRQLIIAPNCRELVEQVVEFHLFNVGLSELVAAALAGSDLQFEITDDSIRISR